MTGLSSRTMSMELLIAVVIMISTSSSSTRKRMNTHTKWAGRMCGPSRIWTKVLNLVMIQELCISPREEAHSTIANKKFDFSHFLWYNYCRKWERNGGVKVSTDSWVPYLQAGGTHIATFKYKRKRFCISCLNSILILYYIIKQWKPHCDIAY